MKSVAYKSSVIAFAFAFLYGCPPVDAPIKNDNFVYLTIAESAGGTVRTLDSNEPNQCPDLCITPHKTRLENYDIVSLEAKAAPGYMFIHWSISAHTPEETIEKECLLEDSITNGSICIIEMDSDFSVTATFKIDTGENDTPAIDLNDYTLSAYGGEPQNSTGQGIVTAIEDAGTTLFMDGNRWRAIDLAYIVTTDTVLEFDYESNIEGEIHAIGFDVDISLNEEANFFQLAGTQNWANNTYAYTGNGEPQHFSIPAGTHFTGSFNFLVFGNDDDASPYDADGRFSNIKLCEVSCS